jgi:DNA polymerase-3 subunit delta'
VINRVNKVPIEGDRNIAIIKDADTITIRGFNRLLKTLEEPHEGTIIMLLSENIENLPQTIVSRCVHVRVLPSDVPKNAKEKKLAEKLITQISDGEPYYHVKNTIEKIGTEKTEIYIVLDCMEDIYRGMLLGKEARFDPESICSAVDLIEETRDRIKRNRNAAYTLKRMALKIGG